MSVNFFPDPLLHDFRESLVRLFHRSAGKPADVDEYGYNLSLWRDLAETAAFGCLLPEAKGGLGLGGHAACALMEEIGRAGVLAPVIDTLAVTMALGGWQAFATLQPLAGLAHGRTRVAVGWGNNGRFGDAGNALPLAELAKDGWVIAGYSEGIAFAEGADAFLLPIERVRDGATQCTELLLVASGQEGIHLSTESTFDGGRMTRLRFSGDTPLVATAVETDDAMALIDRARSIAVLAQAAETVGAMQRLRDLTLDYARLRHQFGVPIGANQVIQHRIVDLFSACELASARVQAAMAHIEGPETQLDLRDVSKVKLHVDRAARHVAQDSIQIHGGMGMSNENEVARHVKRITVMAQTYVDRFGLLSFCGRACHDA